MLNEHNIISESEQKNDANTFVFKNRIFDIYKRSACDIKQNRPINSKFKIKGPLYRDKNGHFSSLFLVRLSKAYKCPAELV